jgi:hypothetical protein
MHFDYTRIIQFWFCHCGIIRNIFLTQPFHHLSFSCVGSRVFFVHNAVVGCVVQYQNRMRRQVWNQLGTKPIFKIRAVHFIMIVPGFCS